MTIIKLFAMRYISKFTPLFPPIKIFIVPHASLKCIGLWSTRPSTESLLELIQKKTMGYSYGKLCMGDSINDNRCHLDATMP